MLGGRYRLVLPLIPFWMREKPKVPHINARAETVHKLPLFREAFAKRRGANSCLSIKLSTTTQRYLRRELLPAKNVDNQIRNSRDRKVRSKRASGLKTEGSRFLYAPS